LVDVDEMVQQPCENAGYGEHRQGGEPVSEVVGLDVLEHELHVYEIYLEADGAEEDERAQGHLRQTLEEGGEQQEGGDGERDIRPTLDEEREAAAQSVLEVHACEEAHGEHDEQEPQNVPVELAPRAHSLADVYAEQEDGDAAGKNLEMSDGVAQRQPVVDEQAEQQERHGQPAVERGAPDEPHVERCEGVEEEDGGNEPEVEFEPLPEAPVDEHLEHGVARAYLSVEAFRDIVDGGDDEPCGIDAAVAPHVEMAQRGLPAPSEPQSDAAEEEEHIDPHIAAAGKAQPQRLVARTADVEQHDDEHGEAHEGTAVAAKPCELDIIH